MVFVSGLFTGVSFTLLDDRPALTMRQCEENPAIARFILHFRDSFEFQAAWDAYFLKLERVPECVLDALRGEDDGLGVGLWKPVI